MSTVLKTEHKFIIKIFFDQIGSIDKKITFPKAKTQTTHKIFDIWYLRWVFKKI